MLIGCYGCRFEDNAGVNRGMQIAFRVFIAAALSLGSGGCKQQAACDGASIIGRVEHVRVEDIESTFKARIDTGAGVSSLHAKILEVKPAAGDKPERVVFEVQDEVGELRVLERKVLRWLDIKGKGTRKRQRRPVVIMAFCFGGKRVQGRVNLADRSEFLYPLLIGRNILKEGEFLIDPRKKFAGKAACGLTSDH